MKHRLYKGLLTLMTILFVTQTNICAQTTSVELGGSSIETDQDFPYCSYYKNGTSQFIYTADEIGYSGSITQIAFKVSTTASLSGTIKVYMGETDKETFSSASDAMTYSQLSCVNSGYRTIGSSTGWETVTLSSPFQYSGKKNLVVVVTRQASSYSANLKYFVNTKANASLYRLSDEDSGCGDFNNTSYSYSTSDTRPNMKVTMTNAKSNATPSNLVTIGTGTDDTNTAPYCAAYKYSQSEMIYAPSEVGKAGTIESLAFNLQSSTMVSYGDAVKIYMGYKSSSTFSSYTDKVGTSNLTLVYDGTKTLGSSLQGGIWETFKLDNPFYYNGTGNLVVAVTRASNNIYVSHKYYYSTASNTVLTRGSDGGFTGLDDTYSSWSLRSDRPNIKFVKTDDKTTIRAKYDVRMTNSATTLLASTDNVNNMIIDGVALSSPVTSYQFTTTGEHEVIYVQNEGPLNISFKNVSSLASISLPTSITGIGQEVFRGCYSLESVTAKGTLTTVGDYAFSNCQNLTTCPDFSYLTSIGSYAFEYMNNAGSSGALTLNSVSSLSANALQDANFSTISIQSTALTSIPAEAFRYATMTEIHLPSSVTSIASDAFSDCEALTSISVNSSNSKYYSSNNCLIERSTNRLIVGPKTNGTLTIPSGVQTIGSYAFCGRRVTKLVLPTSVTSIEANAFVGAYATGTPGNIICNGTTPPTLNANAFTSGYTTKVTVPFDAYSAYAANSEWSKHQLRVAVNHGVAVQNTNSQTVANLDYYRYLSGDKYETLFVPFTSDYSLWSGEVSIYSIDNILQQDINNDGQIDKMILEIVPLGSSDQVKANTPYIIKAKSSSTTLAITVSSVNVASTETFDPLVCASTKATYTFTGTYQTKSTTANKEFILSNGTLVQRSYASSVSPQNWYLTIEGRSSSYTVPVTSISIDKAGNNVFKAVTGISLSQSALKVVAGTSATTLTATFTPTDATNKTVTWTSSNTSVATVSTSGAVTPVAAGTATITATTTDGTNLSASCSVTVIARGDVNGDGSFTTADIDGCVKYMMNRSTSGYTYYQAAADYNKSGTVNSTDAVAIVRLVLNGNVSYSAIRRKVAGKNVSESVRCLTVEDMNIQAGETAVMDIDFAEQSDDYLSFQFDMVLPEGVRVKEVLGGDKLNGHAVAFSERKTDGFTRVICYSMEDEVMSNIAGSAIHVVLEADENAHLGNACINLDNIEIVRYDGSTICTERQSVGVNGTGTTNINNVYAGGLQIAVENHTIIITAHADSNVAVYSAAGQLLYHGNMTKGQTHQISATAGVYMINGKKIMVK